MMKQLLVSGVTVMLAASVTAWAGVPWRHAGGEGMRKFVVVQPAVSTDREMLKQAANSVCASGQACVVLFWREGTAVPKKMPMTRVQQRKVIAQYLRNPATGNEELLLKCRADQPKGSKCLR